MAFNIPEIQNTLDCVDIGHNSLTDCIQRLAELQDRFFHKLKKADTEAFSDHLEKYGIEEHIQEAYEYTFKGTVDEQLAEMILLAIKFANIKNINMDKAITAYISNQIHIAKYGKQH